MNLAGFASMPFWAVFVVSSLCLWALAEGGYRLGRARAAHQPQGAEGSFGVATAALLGLVSFLLAFTFGIAATQYSERRAAVLSEANIIGTAYTRAELLPDPEAEELSALIRDYVSLRLDAAVRGQATSEYLKIVRQSEVLHRQMWSVATRVAKTDPNAMNALVLTSLNDLFDVHTERVAYGLYRRIPPVIWLALLIVGGAGVGAMTYRTGALWKRRPDLTPILIFTFAGVVTLIADIDNPQRGALTGNQNPILDLGEAILGEG